MDARAIEKLLYHRSLLGGPASPASMRTLLESPRAARPLAIDLTATAIRRELGALAAVLGGLDALGVHRRHRRELGGDPRRCSTMRRGSASSAMPRPTTPAVALTTRGLRVSAWRCDR